MCTLTLTHSHSHTQTHTGEAVGWQALRACVGQGGDMPLICSVYSRIKIPGYRTDWRRVVTALKRWGLIHLISKNNYYYSFQHVFQSLHFCFWYEIKVNWPQPYCTCRHYKHRQTETLFLIWPKKRVLWSVTLWWTHTQQVQCCVAITTENNRHV